MMKIVLINPPLATSIDTNSLSYPPLGILTLSSFLKLHGHFVKVLDLAINKMSFNEIVQILDNYEADIVGFTVYTEIFNYICELVAFIKGKIPQIKVVLGGPHSIVLPEETITQSQADIVICNEGEAPFIELLTVWEKNCSFDLQDIPGILYKKNGQIYKNPRRGKIQHLNLLPIPDRKSIDISKYHDPYSIISSRGCPGDCIFCATKPINGTKYRTRDAEHILGEIIYLIQEYDAKIISFLEDTFTADSQRIYSLGKLIKDTGIKVRFRCETRIDCMSKELLDCMAEMGFEAIQYGIETGDPKVMKAIKKNIDLEYAEEIIGYTRHKNILPILSFCLGHYADTIETMTRTKDFIKKLTKLYQPRVSVSFNTPFPGTYQYRNLDKLGINLTTTNWNEYTLMKPITYTEKYSVKDLYQIHFQILVVLINEAEKRSEKDV